jgi:hypothetical protein
MQDISPDTIDGEIIEIIQLVGYATQSKARPVAKTLPAATTT